LSIRFCAEGKTPPRSSYFLMLVFVVRFAIFYKILFVFTN